MNLNENSEGNIDIPQDFFSSKQWITFTLLSCAS